jgi:hypothetical protein
VPLATLHTSGDPIVPVGQSERYAEKVASSGAAGLLVQSRTVTRYGHCAFQLGEVLDAFGAVIERARAAARID